MILSVKFTNKQQERVTVWRMSNKVLE